MAIIVPDGAPDPLGGPHAQGAAPHPSPLDGNRQASAITTPGGYLWWYFDALTPEGDGLCCIFFVGSVFSPSYAVRLRHGEAALPTEHCAVNLALYRGGRKIAWVLSEYEELGALGEDEFRVGQSAIRREGAGWRIELRERSAPFRRRIEGEIVVEPLTPPWRECAIGTIPGQPRSAHGWQAAAPRARVTARFSRPDFSVDTLGYHDRNYGDGRLEEAFSRWGWARFHGERETTVLYSFTDRAGVERALWLRGGDGEGVTSSTIDGGPDPIEEAAAPDGELRRLRWGMRLPSSFGVGRPEHLRCEAGRLLETAPFYARFAARLVADGRPPVLGLGEYLDLDRFRAPGRQFLLRYLMRPTWREPLV